MTLHRLRHVSLASLSIDGKHSPAFRLFRLSSRSLANETMQANTALSVEAHFSNNRAIVSDGTAVYYANARGISKAPLDG